MAATVAIVGAGLAGLTAAAYLQARGFAVRVLDKSPRVGGRMATRSFPVPGLGVATFDHGALRWVDDGTADDRCRQSLLAGPARMTAWFTQPDGRTAYRSTAGMRAVAEHNAERVRPELGVRVEACHRTAAGWHLRTDGRPVAADWLVLTPPVPQSLALLGDGVELPMDLLARLRTVEYTRCVALLAAGRGWSRLPASGGAWFDTEPLRAVVDNHAKGVSAVGPAVTIHAAPGASLDLWDQPDDAVTERLLGWAAGWVEWESPVTQVHRWRYNRPLGTWPGPCAAVPGLELVFAGDAFGGPTLDGADRSGRAACDVITGRNDALGGW